MCNIHTMGPSWPYQPVVNRFNNHCIKGKCIGEVYRWLFDKSASKLERLLTIVFKVSVN